MPLRAIQQRRTGPTSLKSHGRRALVYNLAHATLAMRRAAPDMQAACAGGFFRVAAADVFDC